ncbi:dTDP-4-dehydrorhamnose reductase [Sunxiuqinia sp. A32]|uniref:dTDP-4-dehydrorhamnose reductase n=1 Tax=Sunxiuqinia sp. A32 TaxID=3461496 RepID=UPI004045F22A
MKILVTGADGQLGSELRKCSGEFSEFEFIFTDINDLDIAKWKDVEAYFKQHQPNYVINCAAYTAVDVAEKDGFFAELLNTKAPSFLGNIAEKYQARVIHISTDYVFDGTSCTPYLEKDLVNPESIYGKTKLNGEIGLIRENASAIIIRTSWLYSQYGKNFLKTILRLSEERDKLKVVYDQVGTPTYAGDLARAILMIISKTEKKEVVWKPGIYHYSNEGVCSWYDFAKAILEEYQSECEVLPIETVDYPTPARRPAYAVLNKSKIKLIFGVQIPYWRDSLRQCIREIKK